MSQQLTDTTLSDPLSGTKINLMLSIKKETNYKLCIKKFTSTTTILYQPKHLNASNNLILHYITAKTVWLK